MGRRTNHVMTRDWDEREGNLHIRDILSLLSSVTVSP